MGKGYLGGFSIGFGGFPERPNGLDDREDYGAAADDVDEQEDLVSGDPVLDEGAGFTNNNEGDVDEDLEKDYDHGEVDPVEGTAVGVKPWLMWRRLWCRGAWWEHRCW